MKGVCTTKRSNVKTVIRIMSTVVKIEGRERGDRGPIQSNPTTYRKEGKSPRMMKRM